MKRLRAPTTGLKIYDEARSAHLERITERSVATRLFYRKASYDFDADLAKKKSATQVSVFGVLKAVFRSDADQVELNEPLFLRALPIILAALLGGWLRYCRGGLKPRYVTYAIENIDMAAKLSSHSGLSRHITKSVFGFVVRRLFKCFDRVAFGTLASLSAYEDLLGKFPPTVQVRLFPALEPRCLQCELKNNEDQVIFIGAFDNRKGINALMNAWPLVDEKIDRARLVIIGKGFLADQVELWAKYFPDVEVLIDPPRAIIHDRLSSSAVLVLPSESSARWREQVGLPILEGLSHGCRIVTTSDTGLSEWLKDHHHHVISNPKDENALATTIVAAIDSRSAGRDVTDDLPSKSGRVEAEVWLWES